MPRSTFKQPQKVVQQQEDNVYGLRNKKILNAYSRQHFSYQPESFTERQRDMVEQMNLNLQAEYSDLVKETLISVHRALISPGQFEFSDGKIDDKGKVKSAIVYKVRVEILNEQAKKLGYEKVASAEYNAGQVTYEIGRYQRPIVEPLSFSRDGKLTNAKIKQTIQTYYIEDTPNELKSILKKYGKPAKKPVVCEASLFEESPYKNTYSLIKEDDFWNAEDLDNIIGGNRIGLPAAGFKVWNKKVKEVAAGGQVTEAQLSKLSHKQIIEMVNAVEAAEGTVKK